MRTQDSCDSCSAHFNLRLHRIKDAVPSSRKVPHSCDACSAHFNCRLHRIEDAMPSSRKVTISSQKAESNPQDDGLDDGSGKPKVHSRFLDLEGRKGKLQNRVLLVEAACRHRTEMENGGISDEKSLGRGCVSTPPRILDKVHSSDRHALCCFPSFSWRLKICGFLRPQWGIGCPSKSIRRLCCLVAVCKDRKRSVSSRCDGRNRVIWH